MPEGDHKPPKPPVWQARTGTRAHPSFLEYSQSLTDDLPFLLDDLCGSIAHVAGLYGAGLMTPEDAEHLIRGLQNLAARHKQGQWEPTPALEDIHMNIEAALEEHCSGVAGRLHTGRSRNDQVATAIVLHARRRLHAFAQALDGLTKQLIACAQEHLHTPWTARTHDQAAQPATLAFLLAAHAVRANRATDRVLKALDEQNECPLGAGAVAGSTLPLQPEIPAGLLGLKPLENALVATGTRDTAHAALAATTQAAPVLAGLATDLLRLHAHGQYDPPGPLTTGSSLMPHKRNPDALELARAHANRLPVHQDTVLRVTLPLSLGYHRDLQLVKPSLVEALNEAIDTTKILIEHLEPGAFHATPENGLDPAKEQAIRATDAVEALVTQGIPFRTAYHLLAEAAHTSEDLHLPLSQTLPSVLEAHGIQTEGIECAVNALGAGPENRKTRGGPATQRVQQTLDRLTQATTKRQTQLDQTQQKIQQTLDLIERDPMDILQETTTHSFQIPPLYNQGA